MNGEAMRCETLSVLKKCDGEQRGGSELEMGSLRWK